MTCNIDRTGRRLRAAMGAGFIIVGIAWFALVSSAHWAIHGLQALLTVGGAFAVFEGLVGWCAIRAMGVKTPF